MASSHERGQQPEQIRQETRSFIDRATIDAIDRSSGSREAVTRIKNSMERRFLPYVEENEEIADQLSSPGYSSFATETENFLEAKSGFTACVDGRLIVMVYTDPKVGSMHRRLGGLPETRRSTRHGKPVLDDPDLAAAIKTNFERRRSSGKPVQLVEYLGPHIDSAEPTTESCGRQTAQIVASGQAPEIGMRFAAIPEYFDELGEGFYAFDNVAQEAGGKSVTIDLTHDSYTQGLIVGLRNAHHEFNTELDLRSNLGRLRNEGKILTSESLDKRLGRRIEEQMTDRGIGLIDVRDFRRFAPNAISIGKIGHDLTIEEEREGFPWIPDTIRKDMPYFAVKNLAYHMIRNTVYRVAGNIEQGDHALRHHPEQLIRVGPIGADFNVGTIPFIERTARGRLQPDDIEGTKVLYNLAGGVFRSHQINLNEEGRVITVTGMFDEKRYANPNIAQEEFNEVASMVRNNAAWIRDEFEPGIKSGQAIVVGAIHDPSTRRLTHIV